MRITSLEKEIIRSSVKKHFGGNADVYIFGSRVDDDRKGGDIDLEGYPLDASDHYI